MPLKGSNIRHTVVFRLKWPSESPQEADFLKAADRLASLPHVQQFERLRQVGRKNDFRFGLSMEFANENDYASYNSHPLHQAFLQEQWMPNVEDFLEIDYVALE